MFDCWPALTKPGMMGTLNYKLYWYSKFYKIILFVASKTSLHSHSSNLVGPHPSLRVFIPTGLSYPLVNLIWSKITNSKYTVSKNIVYLYWINMDIQGLIMNSTLLNRLHIPLWHSECIIQLDQRAMSFSLIDNPFTFSRAATLQFVVFQKFFLVFWGILDQNK